MNEIAWRSGWKPSDLEPESLWWVKNCEKGNSFVIQVDSDDFAFGMVRPLVMAVIDDDDSDCYLLGPRIRPEDSAELERLRAENKRIRSLLERLYVWDSGHGYSGPVVARCREEMKRFFGPDFDVRAAQVRIDEQARDEAAREMAGGKEANTDA